MAGKTQIYSMIVELNNQPRIITVRVSSDFVEMSIADKNGNVLETLSHEKGQLKFMQFKQ